MLLKGILFKPAKPTPTPLHVQSNPIDIPSKPTPNFTSSEQHLTNHILHPRFVSTYLITQELGKGGFGFVVSAINRQTLQDVAVKFIHKGKSGKECVDLEFGRLPLEVWMVKMMKHENIVSFVDYFEDTLFYYLVTELYGSSNNLSDSVPSSSISDDDDEYFQTALRSTNTPFITPLTKRTSYDLFEFIEKNQKLSELHAKIIFKQIANSIAYLAKNGIVHRDIKDENILVDECGLRVKLIDFGSAALISNTGFAKFLGTIQYASPEVLRGDRYSGPPQEIWALGCLLYVILTGETPFDSPKQAMYKSFKNQSFSKDLTDLLKWMLQKDICKRARIEDVVTHPWVVGNS